MKKPFEPNFNTPRVDYSREENNKLTAHARRKDVMADFRNLEKLDIEWQTEQLAKSFGIYLEFNRAISGEEKDWMYMIRVSIPGGGPISKEQWKVFDDLSEQYGVDPQGHSSLRFTTRQNIQFHWIKKHGVIDVVKTLAEKGMNSLNGCGDNTRNVMGCPLSEFSDVFNARQWAQKCGDYFQLPLDPFIQVFGIDPKYVRKPEQSFGYGPNLLNRKFKIAFSTVHRDPNTGHLTPDNCVELLTNDMAVAPITDGKKVVAFQIYIGGGQGERNGKPALAALAKPLCITTEDKLLQVMDAVVAVHQEWGDRQNRVWARLKYVVKKMGIEWYREQVSARLGFPLEKPNPDHDYGARDLHFGWYKQPSNGLWSYGAFIENGRIIDNSPNGKLKSMVRDVMNKYPVGLFVTPNQDAIFSNIPESAKKDFEDTLSSFGYGKRNGKTYSTLRLKSGACVGRDTCRLTYTDSEQFEPELIDELEKMGWGDMAESIGITGCERQCFRPGTKTIGLVGSGLNRYMFKLFGDETARFQGVPLMTSDGEKLYLRSVPRENVAQVIDVLFKNYKKNAQPQESLGAFHRRLGPEALAAYLKSDPASAPFMEKPFPADCILEP